MENILQYILSRIEEIDPKHGKKLHKSLKALGPDYSEKAETFFQKYDRILSKQGKGIDYGIECYMRMCDDVLYQQIQFMETNKYTTTSFAEANERVYNNPEVMEYYMNGLLMSELLWHHHYKIHRFFKENFPAYVPTIKKHLEIGGGHGLFIQEAVNVLPEGAIDVADISESSIALAKQFVEGGKVNYILTDIYDYKPSFLYDFIVMGEVLEHVEDPLALMKKLYSLLKKGGSAFITTPTNAPAIDHIYLFRNREDIVNILEGAGFTIVTESCIYAEDLPKELAEEMKITMMYAAFIQKK